MIANGEKGPGFVIVLIASLLCAPKLAFAEDGQQPPNDAIDEIVVRGEKSLLRLRYEAYRAEDDFYALFNSLNDDDDYDVRCAREAPTGTRIRKRICRAKFEDDLAAEQARALLIQGDAPSIEGVIHHKKKILLDRMEKLTKEDEGLFKALSDYYDAKKIYESERERRCRDRILTCVN